jgi:hypothetical protein
MWQKQSISFAPGALGVRIPTVTPEASE